jgi:hypothetical protein
MEANSGTNLYTFGGQIITKNSLLATLFRQRRYFVHVTETISDNGKMVLILWSCCPIKQ